MSQILFLDTPENFSNLILKKKISVKNGYFWNFLEFFWNFLERNGLKWVKNGGLKANTTSSSSKFCQDFKNARVFHVDPVAVPENRVFVRQGGVEIGFWFLLGSQKRDFRVE